MRRVVIAVLLLFAIVAGWLLFRGRERQGVESPAPMAAVTAPSSSAFPAGEPAARPATLTPETLAAEYPLSAPLNAPNSTIQRDLDTLAVILDAWRTNFAREGNPVGENHEIAAALAGDNRLELVLIPKKHPALNDRGELCDRWGTPFRFHQLSGDRMEIFSAGPDRKFGTADDVGWSPGAVESLNR